ncbi:hypothetical protein ABZP36_033869 [Zizania latifolia]
MSANGSRVFMSPVVQGKNQSNIMNDMKNRNVSNNKSVPVTGFSFNGGSFLSGNSKESASQVKNPNYYMMYFGFLNFHQFIVRRILWIMVVYKKCLNFFLAVT